jgi:chromosome segregation ATPase
MDERLLIAQVVGSAITTLTVVVGVVLAVIKSGPERRALAVEASQSAAATMQVAMQELRADLAQQRERSADMRRESIDKDIQHSADIRAQREQIEALQAEAKAERERHEKRERELLARVGKLERELADTQAKWQAKYAELEKQYQAVVAENKHLRDRVKALEGKQNEKKVEPEAETKGDAKA